MHQKQDWSTVAKCQGKEYQRRWKRKAAFAFGKDEVVFNKLIEQNTQHPKCSSHHFQNNDDNLSNRSILKDYHMQLTHITILLYISLFLFKENYYCVYLICKLFRSISKRLLITHGNIWITNVKDLLEQISPKCGLVYFIILTQKLLSCKLGKNDKYIITFFVKIFYWFWCHLKKKSTFITISRFAVRQLAANSYMLIQVWCIHLPYCFKNLHSFAPLEG